MQTAETTPATTPAPADTTGWRWTPDDITARCPHYTEEGRELLTWAITWCTHPEHPTPLAQFAHEIGYSENTLGKILNGRYTAPKTGELLPIPEPLLRSLRAWRRTALSRARLTRPKFTPTPTSRTIWQACDLARESQTPVFLYGASHIGKTTALTAYREAHPHHRTAYLSLEPREGSLPFLRRLATELRVPATGSRSTLIAACTAALHRDYLLIIDDLHVALRTLPAGEFFTLCETIRILWDRRHPGILISLTNLGRELLEKSTISALEQLQRRHVHTIPLGDRPRRADIAALIAPYGLTLPGKKETITLHAGTPHALTLSPYDEIAQLTARTGLGTLCERLRYATSLAAREEATAVTWEHLLTAHTIIGLAANAPATDW